MSLINQLEYEKIFKNGIQYSDLEGGESEFLNIYRGKLYSGMGFSQTSENEILGYLKIYKDGEEYGISRKWHANGCIKEERLVQGNSDGYTRRWDENGNLIYEATYITGMCMYEKTTDGNYVIQGIASFRDIYNSKKPYWGIDITQRESFSDKIEKKIKDSYYINGILEIFEKYKEDENENVVNKIKDEIIKFSEKQKEIREKEYSMFHRMADEDEIELNCEIAYYKGEPYTGMTSKFIDDDSISGVALTKLTGYINGKKEGFELLWEPEEILNPSGVEKYGVRSTYLDNNYLWWTKTLLKELSYYKAGKLIDHQEWDNNFAKE